MTRHYYIVGRNLNPSLLIMSVMDITLQGQLILRKQEISSTNTAALTVRTGVVLA